jgi:hypothetical protein
MVISFGRSVCTITCIRARGCNGRDYMVVGFTTTMYLCNQWLSPLILRIRIPLRRGVLDITLCDKVYQWLVAGITTDKLDTGLGLWCWMPLSTIFQFYRGSQFLLVEETGVPGENHRPVASHCKRGRHGHDRLVVGFTIKCAISAYHN